MLLRLHQRPKKNTASERGDKSASTGKLGYGKTHKCQRDHWDLLPGFSNPISLGTPFQQPSSCCRKPEADGSSDTDLLYDQNQCKLGTAPFHGHLRRESEKHEQNGNTDSVIKTAFNIQTLPQLYRDVLVGHYSLS